MSLYNHSTESRFVSRLTRDTLALVLAGGAGSRLRELTAWRAKPALYFGGKFRIIDFPLSNCINSGVRRIGVLTQYKAHSLIRHLVNGWSWFQAGDREFVEILDLGSITLICQDWGGTMGPRVVALDPERFARVLVSNGIMHTAEHPTTGEILMLAWTVRSRARLERPENRAPQLVDSPSSAGRRSPTRVTCSKACAN